MNALGSVSFEEIGPHAFAAAAFGVALASGLRVPEAAYVEVARVRRAILVTADRRQLEAAEKLGIAAVRLSELPPW